MRKMIPKLKILLFAACIVFIFWLNISYNGALIGIISSLWCSVLFAILWALGHCVWGLALSWKSYQSSKSDEALATLERERFHARLNRTGILASVFIALAVISRSAVLAVFFLFVAGVLSLSSLFRKRKVGKQQSAPAVVAKEALVKDKLDSLFTNVSLDRNYHFQLGEIQRLDLFSDPSRCTGNDMLEADYREVRFAQSDICVWEQNRKVDANGNVYVHGSGAESLVFKGRMIRMDFRKPFEGRVQVLSTNFKNAKRSRRITSAIAGNAEERAAWSQVETELESFNQSFDVFSPRERDAFETLTPQMIEGIDLLWQRLRVPLAFCFEGHSMYVFIDSDGRDAFEVSARRTALETQTRLEEDAQIIVDFMETMYFRKQ